jgi:hypothetical protein
MRKRIHGQSVQCTIPPMKNGIIAMTVLAVTVATAIGQQSTSVKKTSEKSFYWKASEVQELGPKDKIRVTKVLAPAERTALMEAIAAQIEPGTKAIDINSNKQLSEAVADTRVKPVNLSDDGIPEFVAQASGGKFCSPTGNCTIWVFQLSGNGYKLILKRAAVQTFAIRSTRTNGFNDLVLGQHGSASEQTLYLYRFIDGRYSKDACYEALWEQLVGDEWQELNEPAITPCKSDDTKKR